MASLEEKMKQDRIVLAKFDVAPLRFEANGKEMMYVYPDTKHEAAGWILYRHPDGQWVRSHRYRVRHCANDPHPDCFPYPSQDGNSTSAIDDHCDAHHATGSSVDREVDQRSLFLRNRRSLRANALLLYLEFTGSRAKHLCNSLRSTAYCTECKLTSRRKRNARQGQLVFRTKGIRIHLAR